jgi:GT2 family glycosyltransferase
VKDTCILVTTFLRDDMLFRCVESIRQYYPAIKIYVGDNGRPSEEKTRFLAEHNCEHLMVTFDCGVSGVRNESIALIPKLYKYIFIVEDDVVFTKGTVLSKLYKAINDSPRIGIAALMLKLNGDSEQHYEGTHWIEGNTKYVRKLKEPIEWQEAAGGVKYCYCDLALNVFLMRRAVWDAVKWDAQFKTALEHADFFCSLKYKLVHGKVEERKKPWRVVYVPSVWANHAVGEETDEYKKFRRRTVGFQLFAAKWGIKYSDSEYNNGILDLETYGQAATGAFDSPRDRLLTDVCETLDRLGLKWWLNSGSCLGAIREKGFIGHDTDLDFGIAPGQDDRWNEIQSAFMEKGFALYRAWVWRDVKAELSFKRDDIKVDLFFYRHCGDGERVWFGAFGPDTLGHWGAFMRFVPRTYPARLFEKPRQIYLRGQKCYVPNPPEEYLVCQYGEDWKTPKRDWQYWIDNKAIDYDFLRVLESGGATTVTALAPESAPAPGEAKPPEFRSLVIKIGRPAPKNEPIAIGIKTFMRTPLLYKTLAAIEQNVKLPYRLYIADDGPVDDEKRWRYQRLKNNGHVVIELPFNSGISVGRNAIVRAATEPFVLIQDDDIAPADAECIPRMMAVLDAAPGIGVVSGLIKGEAGEYFASESYAKGLTLDLAPPLLIRTPATRHVERVGENGPLYVLADQVPNFFVARREALAAVKWDDQIRVEYEHMDWFLGLKQTPWKAAVCLDAHAVHYNRVAERDYFTFRNSQSPAHFLGKWKIAKIVSQLG